MSDQRVVDASVAVKWVIEEDLSDQAEKFYADRTNTEPPLIAAPHFPNEVINAIHQQRRRGRLSDSLADRAVANFAGFNVELRTAPDHAARAYEVAKRFGLPAIYDALYLVLASDLGADLWTADQRLLNTVGGAAPWVRWIGDYGKD